jgi:hypothetical protein
VLVSRQVGINDLLIRAGLGRMVIPSFADLDAAATRVQALANTNITQKEYAAVSRALDPNRIHTRILRVLHSVLS